MSYYTTIGGKRYDKQLLEAFQRSVEGRGDGRVAGSDVDGEIKRRTVDGRRLSKVEIETLRYAASQFRITSRAQEELSAIVEKLSGQQVFDWQRPVNPLTGRLDGQRLDDAALYKAATRFVLDNASDGASVDDGKLFPHLESENLGLFAYVHDGKDAARLVAFGKATLNDDEKAVLDGYDPQQHAVLAVRTTFDEESLYLGLLDRATGEATLAGEVAYVDDLEGNFRDAAAFESVLGMKLDELDGDIDPENWHELDQETLAHALTRGGRLLDLEKSDDVFGPASDMALSRLAYATGSEWGDENIMNGSVGVEVGQLPLGHEPEKAALAILDEATRYDDVAWAEPAAAGAPRGLTDAVIKQASEALHDGFGYAPENKASFKANKKRIQQMLDELGRPADIRVVVASGKGTPAHLDTDEPLDLKTFLFVNEKTGDFFAVTTRDAMM